MNEENLTLFDTSRLPRRAFSPPRNDGHTRRETPPLPHASHCEHFASLSVNSVKQSPYRFAKRPVDCHVGQTRCFATQALLVMTDYAVSRPIIIVAALLPISTAKFVPRSQG